MALTRAYEEHEVTPELRRTYCSIRTAFDLPFVPTLFKLSAGIPEYLLKMWDDLGPVVCSKEFQTAAQAFQEIAHSTAVSGGWTFSDQPKVLVAEPSFLSAREDLNRRVRALLTGLPVKDHRALLKDLDPAKWREIEETGDSFARLLPQFALLTAIWQRSFPSASRLIGAA